MFQRSEKVILQFLLGELDEAEEKAFEDELAESEGLFYATADKENELVDGFIQGTLGPELSIRFERSLAQKPSRQQKLKNAKALQEHITSIKPKSEVEPVRDTFFGRLFSPGRGLVPAAVFGSLLFLLTSLVVFLLIENMRSTAEIAKLNERISKITQVVPDQPDSGESNESGVLTIELENEREENQRRAKEIEDLRARLREPIAEAPKQRETQVRAVTFDSNRRVREIQNITTTSTSENWTSIVIEIPNVSSGAPFSVRLNGNLVKTGIKPRQTPGGVFSVHVSIDDKDLISGDNRITAHDNSGREVSGFILKAID